MSIDWKTLNEKANQLRAGPTTITDPDKTIYDTIFSGLSVKLSEVANEAPSGGGSTLTVYADTVVVDYPSFDARGIVVVARSLDLTQLVGAAMPMRVPDDGMPRIAEFLVKETISGPFKLMTSEAKPGAQSYTVPIGDSPLQAVYFTVNANGSTNSEVKRDAADLTDLIHRGWALNSLKSSFIAAQWLLNSDNAEDRKTAKSMLAWVVSCIRAIGTDGIAGDFGELYHQAAALLVTLNVESGAYYVPVLSSNIYKGQINTLLDALQSYEDSLNTLEVRTDIKKAIEDVSGTLEGVAQDQTGPIQTQLDNTTQNIANLGDDIRTLQQQFDIQYSESTTRYALMEAAIVDAQTKKLVEDVISMALNVVKLGIDAGKLVATGGADATAWSDIAETVVDGVEQMVALGQTVAEQIESSGATAGSQLAVRAKELMTAQQQLMISFQAGTVLWAQAQKTANEVVAKLPPELASVTVDPSLAWDNYLAEAEAELPAVEGAEDATKKYLVSLKILTQYGKAMNAKFVAYSAQLARATVTIAELKAARTIKARWDALQQQAKTEEEQLACLKGVLQSRADAIKGSVYVAWSNYRNSYFYLYFQEPPAKINPDMNAAALKGVFADVSQWVARLLGDGPGGQTINLPNENVTIPLEFSILKQGETGADGTDKALLTPAAGSQSAVLTWSIPVGIDMLRGVLPSGGKVAIWIKEASFFLDGVRPNNKGRVLAKVATSGSYENGFGPGRTYDFVSKALAGDYGYIVQDEQVYDSWSVDTDVYLTPTPYTQWTMKFDPDGGDPGGATKLSMNLVVVYKTGS